MYTAKYDRQIRLFGTETQSKLAGLRVQILGKPNFSSSEILKNLVLLGVGRIIVQKDILEHTRKLVPDDLTDINENLDIELSDKRKDSEFLFSVDMVAEDRGHGVGMCFVCSKCLTIRMDSSSHECPGVDCVDASCAVAGQCLVGGLAVQEFVKMIQGRKHASCYRVEL